MEKQFTGSGPNAVKCCIGKHCFIRHRGGSDKKVIGGNVTTTLHIGGTKAQKCPACAFKGAYHVTAQCKFLQSSTPSPPPKHNCPIVLTVLPSIFIDPTLKPAMRYNHLVALPPSPPGRRVSAHTLPISASCF
eukprot:1156717-Pelagomonas_calceolata.AAC.8